MVETVVFYLETLKNNVRSPGKLTGNCGHFFVYKI